MKKVEDYPIGSVFCLLYSHYPNRRWVVKYLGNGRITWLEEVDKHFTKEDGYSDNYQDTDPATDLEILQLEECIRTNSFIPISQIKLPEDSYSIF